MTRGLSGTARLALPVALFATALLGGIASGDPGKKEAPFAGVRRIHSYDAAGRLVRTGDGNGNFVSYAWDGSGNSTATPARRWWHASMKKPTKGAWVFSVSGDGSVEGWGADGERGFYALSGDLDLEAGTGTFELSDIGASAELVSGTFELSKVKTKSGPDGPTAFSAGGSSATLGSLALTAVTPRGSMAGFTGRFANAKNLAKVGQDKVPLGEVLFVSTGNPAESSDLGGAVAGRLMRDPKGAAYGTVTLGDLDHVVSGKLKDGAKSVKLKTGKGAAVKFQLQVKP